MDMIFGILVGISLAASCGFRVFVPLLVMSVALRTGYLEVAEEWNWISSWPALTTLSVATVTEMSAYYLPWMDNLLDTISTPAAVVAGIIAMAASISEMEPLLKWSLAVMGGGGIAGAAQVATVTTRGASSLMTGGLGNPAVATLELMMSFVLSVLAILVPILAAALVLSIGFFVARHLLRQRVGRRTGHLKS